MSFYQARDLQPKSESGTGPDVTELRIARGLYTYFGWFPWKDFEGESFSEGEVCRLTGGGTDATMPAEGTADPNGQADPVI